jgi:hypothetical protein
MRSVTAGAGVTKSRHATSLRQRVSRSARRTGANVMRRAGINLAVSGFIGKRRSRSRQARIDR